MKRILQLIIIFFISFRLSGQAGAGPSVLDRLITHFKKYRRSDIPDTSRVLYKTNWTSDNFSLSMAEPVLQFDTARIVLMNPYFSKKYEEAEENTENIKNFPRSYTVVWQQHLVALFENGRFACYDMQSFNRDTAMEKKLNTRVFTSHWLIGQTLVARSGNRDYAWRNNEWVKIKNNVLLAGQPVLWDDEDFLVFGDCFGEWGGTVYFYEKATGNTYFTESSCTNTVTREADGYHVMAQLGHMNGSSDVKIIRDPQKLTQAQSHEINKTYNGQALGYMDKSGAYTKKLDLYGIQLFSAFPHAGMDLYIANLADLTFLATITNNEVQIVHPLFFDDLYTHQPVTRQYGAYTVINMDFYGIGLDREIALLVIHNNKILKIDWNEDHRR